MAKSIDLSNTDNLCQAADAWGESGTEGAFQTAGRRQMELAQRIERSYPM
jgi:hypothetical protein